VIFTPPGKRGRLRPGTPVPDRRTQLGVILTAVCGRAGICSRCQRQARVRAAFPKHRPVTVAADALEPGKRGRGALLKDKRGLIGKAAAGCQACIPSDGGDRRARRKPGGTAKSCASSQRARHGVDPATRLISGRVTGTPTCTNPFGRCRTAGAGAGPDQWGNSRARSCACRCCASCNPALAQGRLAGQRRGCSTAGPAPRRKSSISGQACMRRPLRSWQAICGSTTIAAHLFADLRDGTVLASAGIYDPQIRFWRGSDERVSFGMMEPGRRLEMNRCGGKRR